MSTTTKTEPPVDQPAADVVALVAPPERGKTFIDDDVISAIARRTADEVPGVHQLGASSLRSLLPFRGGSGGIDAEVGLQEAAVDIDLTVAYGYCVRDVAEQVRERVIEAVERMTGRTVVEVNIYVVDIHLPKTPARRRRELA